MEIKEWFKKENGRKLIISTIMLLLIIAWMVLIYYFSSMKSDESDKTSSETVATIIDNSLKITNKIGATHANSSYSDILAASKVINPLIRKVAHFSEYFILAVLVIIFLNYVIENKKYIIVFLISLVICALYAASDEFHQVFISGRSAQIIDVCIDTFGSLIGLLLYSTYYWAYMIGKKKNFVKVKENKDYTIKG